MGSTLKKQNITAQDTVLVDATEIRINRPQKNSEETTLARRNATQPKRKLS